jgi:hypothetical protein
LKLFWFLRLTIREFFTVRTCGKISAKACVDEEAREKLHLTKVK